MGMAQALLPEFDAEMAKTRTTLERVPEDKFEWQPHKKSMTMSALATHIANLPSWVSVTLEQDGFDIDPPDGDSPRQEPISSVADALTRFDQNVAQARESLSGAPGMLLGPDAPALRGGRDEPGVDRCDRVLRTSGKDYAGGPGRFDPIRRSAHWSGGAPVAADLAPSARPYPTTLPSWR